MALQLSISQLKKEWTEGLPANLKVGLEHLSGFTMDDVVVHYYSSKPADLNAAAYACGSHIYIAPGGERHLPHEAWHVVQQKQGRVQPLQLRKGIWVNDDKQLEEEADTMGYIATQLPVKETIQNAKRILINDTVVQLAGGNGLPEDYTIPVGTILTHGTPVKQFDPNWLTRYSPGLVKESKVLPTAPAWFAVNNPDFSVHAAARFTPVAENSRFYIHCYRVVKPIFLIRCDDVADLSVYINQLDNIGPVYMNDVAAAIRLNRLNVMLDGYCVTQDLVRAEEEVILFNPGLKKIESFYISEFDIKANGHQHHDLSGFSKYDYDHTGGGPGSLRFVS